MRTMRKLSANIRQLILLKEVLTLLWDPSQEVPWGEARVVAGELLISQEKS